MPASSHWSTRYVRVRGHRVRLILSLSDSKPVHWFQKGRYVVALCVIVFTGIGLLTEVGEVPIQALATRYLLLAAMLGLLGLVFWFDSTILK